jgi:hypothetical protein
MQTVKVYIVESSISRREIQARNKKEAKELFLQQVPSAKNEKLTIK